MRRVLLALVLAVFLAAMAVFPLPVAAAGFEITDVSVPSSAPAGNTVTVSATGGGDEDLDNTVVISIYRLDTNERLCSREVSLPGTVSCSGSFTMPTEDVEIKAVLRFGTGGTIDGHRTTITAEDPTTPPDDGTGDDGGGNDGAGETPDGTTPSGDGNSDSSGGDSGDKGIVETIVGGLTDTAKTDWTSLITGALRDFFVAVLLPSAKDLLTMVYGVLSWIPDIHPNPAVEDVHRVTLRVAIMLSLLGFMAAGLLYQVGPIFGLSYQEVRLILPRLIAALLFAAVSLPILQLFVDLANAVTMAFQPEMLQADLGSVLTSITAGTVVLLALFLNTMLLVGVVAVYLVLDVYVLFVAAISPLIAIAWAIPFTKRYAQAFIGGFWTALAAGPLSMLVLRFVFALMRVSGSTPLQSVANWMYGIVAFVLLLVIPFQLYGASQALVGRTFYMAGTIQQQASHRYRQYRNQQEDWQSLDSAVEAEYGVDLSERGAYAREAYRDRYRNEHGDPNTGTSERGEQ